MKAPGVQSGKRAIFWMAGLLVLLLATIACKVSLPGSPSEENAKPGEILFSDDFSKSANGWGIWNRDGAAVEYHNGGLRILVNEVQYDFWSVAGKDFRDIQIEVDATKINGPDDNDFGLICRYQDKNNFYMMVVSSDGYYGIAKLKDGQYSMISADQLQYSETVASGQSVNRLQAVCLGPLLRLYANGQMLVEVQDSEFTSGDVGVLAGAYDVPGVDILFDNFVVKKPVD